MQEDDFILEVNGSAVGFIRGRIISSGRSMAIGRQDG